jgi:signal transduction histidine kinase
VLAHSLGALTVQLELAEALLADHDEPRQALDRVRRARRLAAEGMAEAREAVAALQRDVPSVPEALGRLAERYGRDHAAAVEVTTEGEPRDVPTGVAVPLLRAAREALTNAGRHAPGAPVRLVTEFRPESLRLTVANGAPARPPGARGEPGHGLAGMRERLELVGGRLSAGPDGPGWRVTAEVPVP